jgi:hypothetical protein
MHVIGHDYVLAYGNIELVVCESAELNKRRMNFDRSEAASAPMRAKRYKI